MVFHLVAQTFNGGAGTAVQNDRLTQIPGLCPSDELFRLQPQRGGQEDAVGAAVQMAADVLTGQVDAGAFQGKVGQGEGVPGDLGSHSVQQLPTAPVNFF